jgi:hypothetical protein
LDSGGHGEAGSPTVEEPVEFFKEHEVLNCGSDTRLFVSTEPVAINNGRAKPGLIVVESLLLQSKLSLVSSN